MKIPNCSLCKKPTSIKDAVIEVDSMKAAAQWSRAQKRTFDMHKQDEAEGTISFIPVSDRPYEDPVPWQWNHINCGEELGYWFDAERMQTPEEALGWTLHLNKKVWLLHTDWEHFVDDLGFVEHG